MEQLLISVSYTHLDVYKRQQMEMANQISILIEMVIRYQMSISTQIIQAIGNQVVKVEIKMEYGNQTQILIQKVVVKVMLTTIVQLLIKIEMV